MSFLSKIFNKTARQANFSISPVRLPQHSKFDASFSHKTTMSEGRLVPIFWDFTIPGDVLSAESSAVIRFNDLLRPFMDELYYEQFWFFVPFRLVWDNYAKFKGAKESPSDSNDYTIPICSIPKNTSSNALKPQGLANYLAGIDGNQLADGKSLVLNALILRAYNLVVNDWFLPAEIVGRASVPKGDGPDDISNYNNGSCWRIFKKADYFTTALPSPINGAQVMLPISGSAPVSVYGDGKALAIDGGRRSGGGFPILGPLALMNDDTGTAETLNLGTYGQSGAQAVMYDLGGMSNYDVTYPQQLTEPTGAKKIGVASKAMINKYNSAATYPITSGLVGEVDLSSATSISIQQFRELVAINHLKEIDIRYGMRYTELLMSHYGVSNGDLSLQRSQFLGKNRQSISLVQVPQTSAATSSSPQASLSAYAMQQARGGFSRTSFGEEGIVFCLVSIRSALTYQQGINRHLFKRTRFDFFWPEFQNLSDQIVYQGEIYYTGDDTEDKKVFGYQRRYAEYMYKPNMISGWLNSMSSEPLDMWHLSQKFTSAPKLNYSFLVENAPIDRVRSVIDENYNAPFLIDYNVVCHWMRPMSMNSIPGLDKL